MTRWTSKLWVVLLGLTLSAALLAGDASAQQKTLKEQLVGAWRSSPARASARWQPCLGCQPERLLIFTADGLILLDHTRSDFQNRAKNSMQAPRMRNKAAVHGSIGSSAVYGGRGE